MNSILRKITRADVVRDPFPHVVIDGALEDELYARLAASFPSADAIVDGQPIENNAPYRMPAARLLGDARVDACWKEFVRYHTSRAFFVEAVSLFDELSPFAGARTSIRNAEPLADVALDCQPCWGAPVTHPSSSDPCHVDRPITIFGGLLYCRLAGDDADGGDLELYRFRGHERRYDATRHVDPSLVEPVRRIPYAANRLVFFLQSPDSLHGVTVRTATKWPRLHVNFLAQLQTNFFELSSHPAPTPTEGDAPRPWDDPSSALRAPSPLTRGEGLLSSPLARVKVSSPSPRVERGEGGQRPGEGSCHRRDARMSEAPC
jgi:hypothetical protein